jgi:hypothetical protein
LNDLERRRSRSITRLGVTTSLGVYLNASTIMGRRTAILPVFRSEIPSIGGANGDDHKLALSPGFQSSKFERLAQA